MGWFDVKDGFRVDVSLFRVDWLFRGFEDASSFGGDGIWSLIHGDFGDRISGVRFRLLRTRRDYRLLGCKCCDSSCAEAWFVVLIGTRRDMGDWLFNRFFAWSRRNLGDGFVFFEFGGCFYCDRMLMGRC